VTRVAVFGASGFLGATLVERAMTWDGYAIKPIIHGSGGAARLARHAVPLQMADLLVPETIRQALSDCTHVVNCSRGPGDVMLEGLENLLEASRKAGVRRFVHISSVAVYGEEVQGTIDEAATPAPVPGTYGAMKLAQDRMVARAAARGLSSVVLCPPNISGPYSAFLLEVVRALRGGELALVDDGCLPCELVDVENLVHAVRLALDARESDAQRIFITDGEAASWKAVAESLAPLGDRPLPLPSMPRQEAERRVAAASPRRPSITAAVKHLIASDVRDALRRDPWLAQAEKRLKALVRAVPGLEPVARRHATGGRAVGKPAAGRTYSDRLLRVQLRDVRYSTARATGQLGYEPPVSFSGSMQAFQTFYAAHVGWNDEWWPLVSHLYGT
jgi:nucleoside-diphosphate-sugar epimerase